MESTNLKISDEYWQCFHFFKKVNEHSTYSLTLMFIFHRPSNNPTHMHFKKDCQDGLYMYFILKMDFNHFSLRNFFALYKSYIKPFFIMNYNKHSLYDGYQSSIFVSTEYDVYVK